MKTNYWRIIRFCWGLINIRRFHKLQITTKYTIYLMYDCTEMIATKLHPNKTVKSQQ